MHSKKIIGAFAVSAIAAAVLAACGGGGGSAGTAHQRYNIRLTASPSALPTNYANHPALGGPITNPYYSIIRADVSEGDNHVPVPTSTLNCSVDDYDVGALFDPGKEDDLIKDDDGNVIGRKLWRANTFDTSAGVATFGLLAGDKSGVVRVQCAVNDPRDGMETSDYVDVQVGYATGLPAQVNFVTTASTGAGLTFDNGQPLAPGNTMTLQVSVVDSAQQPVPNPTAANVLAEIVPSGSPAEQGARIGNVPFGQAAYATTMNGVATFPLTAGTGEGPLCVQVQVDRNDNNVTNGIVDPATARYCFEVNGAGALQLNVPSTVYVGVGGGTTAVTATGGTAPYTYMLSGANAEGVCTDAAGNVTSRGVFSIDNNGVITVPACLPAGSTHNFTVVVTDANGNTATEDVTISIGAATSGVGINLPSAFRTFDFSRGGTVAVNANSGTPPYTYSFAGANTLAITISEDGVITVPAGTCAPNESEDGSVTYTPSGGVRPGNYNLLIRATDAAGNTTDAPFTFTVNNDCCSLSPSCTIGGVGQFSPGTGSGSSGGGQ